MDLCGDKLENVKSIDNIPDGTAIKMYGEDSNGDLIKDDVPSGGGGASAFTELSDVPESYTDQAGKMLVVNENENALEFTDMPSGGGLPDIITIVNSDIGDERSFSFGKEDDKFFLIRKDTVEGFSGEVSRYTLDFLNGLFKVYRNPEHTPPDEITLGATGAADGKYLKCVDDDGTCEWADVSGGSGGIPSGTYGQTLRYNSSNEIEATDRIQVTDTNLQLRTDYVNGDNETNAGVGIESSDDGMSNCGVYSFIANQFGSKESYVWSLVNSDEFDNLSSTIEIITDKLTINYNEGLTGSCTIDGQTLTFENGILIGASPNLS